jgi:hypothetical protein
MGSRANENTREDRGRAESGAAATILDPIQHAAGGFWPDHLPAGLAVVLAMPDRAAMSADSRGDLQVISRMGHCALRVLAALLIARGSAGAIDLYEIQVYSTRIAQPQHLQFELHSNSVTTATGRLAHEELRPYEIHETLEVNYGLMEHLAIGQYLCTAKLENGNYEYAGARTKMHFAIGDPEQWPVAVGINLELDYMRRAADEHPLSLEIRPILDKRWGKLWFVVNPTIDKPFSGPGEKGLGLGPSGFISYDLLSWLSPTVEYYSDIGPFRALPSVQRQQHFIVPTVNLDLDPRLELNLGVGIGLTEASNGVFVKSIVGWTF